MNKQRGSASLLVLAVGAFAVVLGLLVVDVATFVHARGRAQAAADAAALAAAPVTFRPYGAAGSPAAEAAWFAAANKATLVECRCPVDSSFNPRTVAVEVMVAVEPLLLPASRVRATSRAEFEPTRLRR